MLDGVRRRLNRAKTAAHLRTGGLYGRLPEPVDDPFGGAVQPAAKVIVKMRIVRADGTVEDLPDGVGVMYDSGGR